MNITLNDLSPGTEFEYVNQKDSYRRGKFLVLNSKGHYLRPALGIGCVFIFSYTTKAVCRHWGELEVNVISKPEKTVENTMGRFIGWKFGVPVRVLDRYNKVVRILRYLVYECKSGFVTIDEHGDRANWIKSGKISSGGRGYSYELIPHEYESFYPHGPRYPVCSSLNYTSFCNSYDRMNCLGAVGQPLTEKPTAKLTLEDGTEITLSAETTATLKKQLGR